MTRARPPTGVRPDEHLRGPPRVVAAGLSYVELADQLTDYVLAQASPTSSCYRLPSIRSADPGATRSPRTTRPPPASAHRMSSGTLVDRLHQAGIGVIMDWVPAPLPRDAGRPGPVRRPPLRARGSPPRRRLDWGTYVFDFGRPGAQLPGGQRPVLAEEFHIDGLRVDAVASMLYLDYSRRPAAGPERLRRPGEPEAVQFLQGDERHRPQDRARNRDHRRGVDVLAGRHQGDEPDWRPWLFDEVEHGVDARHPGLRKPRPDLPQLPPPRDDVFHAVRVQRELRPADQPRRGGARQGHAVGPYPRQRPRQGRRATRPAGSTSGPTPARSCCSWAGTSGSAPNGRRSVAWTGGSSTSTASPSGIQRFMADVNTLYRSRRCGARTPGQRATPGSTRTTPTKQRAELPALRLRRIGNGLRVQLRRQRAQQLPAGTAAGRHLARGAQQ